MPKQFVTTSQDRSNAVEASMASLYLKRIAERLSIDEEGCWICSGAGRGYAGYPVISYRGRTVTVGRLLLHFCKNFDLNSKLFACHHCDNPKCVNPDHLFLGTNRDNFEDCKRKERVSRGEKHTCAKLSDDQVNKLRADHAAGMGSVRLARKYKITAPYAWRLATGRRRK